MNQIENYSKKMFEDIKHIDENQVEYWSARELQQVLEYKKWENFLKVINVAMIACKASKSDISSDFLEVRKIVRSGATSKPILDFRLSRYACYLIVQNADPRKKVVALGQTYFAIQTRKQELFEHNYIGLTEEEKRLLHRSATRRENISLNQIAADSGVKNFGKFHDAGYMGLYNGETADDIFKRKGLKYRQEILDYMTSEELVANEFRISQTLAKLKREVVSTEKESCDIHKNVGIAIRNAIKEIGGIMPEDLPTPEKSVKEIENNMKEELLKK